MIFLIFGKFYDGALAWVERSLVVYVNQKLIIRIVYN